MPAPRVTIAFVPREVFSQTQMSLEAVLENTKEPFDLVCVDGGSPPATRAWLEDMAQTHDFTLLRSESYLTPNQARNLALQHVHTPYVVFVDNDVIPSTGWLQPLLDCADETGAWAVGPLYFEHLPLESRVHMAGGISRLLKDSDGRRYYEEKHHLAHRPLAEIDTPLTRQETELIEFHTVLVSMQAFEVTGPLDEGLLNHAEHADFSLCIREAGGKVYLEPASRITYVPPRKLSDEDRSFFELCWSEAWNEASLRHFSRKWDLAPKHKEISVARWWMRHHRRYGSRVLARVRKVFGPRFTHYAQQLGFAQAEALWNRWRYPLGQFSKVSAPEVEVVRLSRSHSQQVA